jgi:hypothetical protein
MGKEFTALIRSFGGLALEYVSLTETDFTSSPEGAYIPPERGVYRRLPNPRQIQILQDCPGVIETFQTSDCELFLPCNNIGIENDSGDGRLFMAKNSGTGVVTIKDYLGNQLFSLPRYGSIIIVGNNNNNWDFYFNAKNISFTPTSPFTSNNVQDAIEQSYTLALDVVNTSASPGFSFGRSGNVSKGAYLSNETVPSNVTGRFVYISNAVISAVFIGTEDTGTYKFGVYKHDGGGDNLALIGTVTVVGKKGDSFSVNWPVETGKYLAVRVENDSTDQPKNVVAGLELRGTN